MNTGVIATRYARALLSYADETSSADAVYAQIAGIFNSGGQLPADMEPALAGILGLLLKNGREDCIVYVLKSYQRLYNKARGVLAATVTVAAENTCIEEKLRSVLEAKTGKKVIFETKVNPDIIGGFSVELDDLLMDASVATQLDRIRAAYAANNKRII